LAFEFKFPDVGEGITEGEVVKWHVNEGDTVEEDQVLVEIETDKAVVEIPSPVAGTVLKRNFEEGGIINVGDVMVVIEDTGAKAAKPVERTEAFPERTEETDRVPEPEAVPSTVRSPRVAVAAAPATRRIARELGVDLTAVTGTGPGGRITAEDVRSATQGEHVGVIPTSEADVAVPRPAIEGTEAEDRVQIRGVRKRVSEAMVTSTRTIPHVTHVDEVDVSRFIRLRERLLERWGEDGPKPSYMPFIIKAVARTLSEFPAMNASVDEKRGEIVYKKYYHIGMATATPDGLIVPVIRHADRLSVLQLSAEVDRLAAATRTRKVPLEDLRGATFSITNYGSIGGLFGTPIIHHPETAILGLGRFFRKVIRVEGEFAERDFVYFSLSFDHRVADGADAAQFVNALKRWFEEPETHFLELI
jgi:pyruvate dehydrogenase E2 component (dihydrolipoamide acetyltransferase)